MNINLCTDYLVQVLKSAITDTKPDNMPDGIKTIGTTEVEVRVYPEIVAKLKVIVTEE